jgi:hypothetical protein
MPRRAPGFDAPLAPLGATVRTGHWSVDGLRSLLLCHEGAGRPFDLQRRALCGVPALGDATWSPSGFLSFSNVNDNVSIAASSADVTPTQRATVLVVRRKHDTTARASFLFGATAAGTTDRCAASVPFNDGTVYWDFGNTSGPGRLSVAGLTFTTDPEMWAFVAGSRGMAIYRDGLLLASSSTATSRVDIGGEFAVNAGPVSGDLEDVSFFALLDAEWTAEQVQAWVADPYLMLAPPSKALLVGPPLAEFTLPAALAGITGPIYWSTLAHRDAAGDPQRFPWAPISIADPAGYFDGFKDALLLSVGEISCPLSDRTGRLQVPTCDVTYSDFPGSDGLMLLRGMLGRDTQKALRGKEFTMYAITDEQRRLGYQPVVVFRGFVDRYEGPADYRFVIHAKGWLAKRLRQKLWTDRIKDIFPAAPAETMERAVPIAFGALSDEGSDEGPIDFVDDEAGRGGSGDDLNPESSYGDLPVAAPTGLTVVEVAASGNLNLGDNPGNQFCVMATRIVAGVEGDASPFYPAAITPVVITGDGAAVRATCANDGADSYRFYFGRVYFGMRFLYYMETTDPVTGVLFTDHPTLASQGVIPITPGGVYSSGMFGLARVCAVMLDGSRTALSVYAHLFSEGYFRPLRLAWSALSGVDHYEVYTDYPSGSFVRRWDVPTSQVNGNGDPYWEADVRAGWAAVPLGPPVPAGVIAPIHCGKFTDLVGFADWDGFLISGRPCVEFVAAYVGATRVLESQYGVDLVAPGKPGYTTAFGSLPYTAGDYTPTMIFVRGPMRDRILGISIDPTESVGIEDFRVNVLGHANLAGTDVETSIYEHLRRISKNVVLADAPRITGEWDADPLFTDGTRRLDDASVDQAAADAAVVLPTGPEAARWLPGDMTVEDFFRDICPSGKLKVGIKPNGQMVACVHNPAASPVADIDEELEVIAGSFAFEVTDQGFANATPYRYASTYDLEGTVLLIDGVTEEDVVSQSADQYEERLVDDVLDLTWRRATNAARDVALAFLAESRYLPQPARAESVLHWIHRSPGEVNAVTHRQGATESGYVRRKHAIVGMTISLQDCRVGLNLLDMRTEDQDPVTPDATLLAFSGFGDAPMKFLDGTGASVTAPASNPETGGGCDGFIKLLTAGWAQVGGFGVDFTVTGVGVYSDDFLSVAEAASTGTGAAGRGIGTDASGNFYCVGGSGGNVRIKKFNDAAVFQAEWNVGAGGTQHCAVSRDGTVGYYFFSSTPTVLRAWDLVGDTSLGTFATEAGANTFTPIATLSNGDVLVGWRQTGATSGYVKHYDSTGALLYTYTFSGTNTDPTWIAVMPDEASFWVGYYEDGVATYSGMTMAKIEIGTGSVLASFDPDDGTFQFDGSFAVSQ